MNGRSLLRSMLLIFNAFFALSLILSSLAHLIDPNTLLFPAFFGLAFMPLLIMNLMLLFAWLMIKPSFSLINLLVIALSWNSIDRHIQFIPEQQTHGQNDLKIMSFNVRLFDLYNWKGNTETRNEILEYMESENADVHCFQEYFSSTDKSYFNTTDTLLKAAFAREIHDDYTAILHQGKNRFGIATLSSPKVINRAKIPLDTAMHNIAIYSDVLFNQDTIRIFNVHLASVHLSGLEQEINEHLENNDQEGQLKDLQRILNRLSSGFKRRAKQAHVIKQYVQNSPHPVVVCGDLNDTPASYAYSELSEGLQDAFRVKGRGIGSTYIGIYPMLRIDFILVDPSLDIHAFETSKVSLSDHRPLIVELGYSKETTHP